MDCEQTAFQTVCVVHCFLGSFTCQDWVVRVGTLLVVTCCLRFRGGAQWQTSVVSPLEAIRK